MKSLRFREYRAKTNVTLHTAENELKLLVAEME
jgi:hypothetical protein